MASTGEGSNQGNTPTWRRRVAHRFSWWDHRDERKPRGTIAHENTETGPRLKSVRRASTTRNKKGCGRSQHPRKVD